MKLSQGRSLAILKVIFLAYFIVVSGDFATSIIISCFFGCPLIWQFSKIIFLKGAQIGFFNVLCLRLNFEIIFLGLPKHKKWGFRAFLCFFLKEKKRAPQK